MADDDLLYVNGIDGDTGGYALAPMTGAELSQRLRGSTPAENLDELRFRKNRPNASPVKAGVDPTALDQSGWGVVFAGDADPAVREALQPLLNLREKQAGAHFKVYAGDDGFKPRESKAKFLARHGAGPGPADPDKVPYYLLLVGSPESIPYRFQSQLDVQHATGRICFDTVEDYAAYAAGVVAAETTAAVRPRKVSFFGVENADDLATQMSTERLLGPLAEYLGKRSDFEVETVMREEATKAALARLLGGGEATPSLLFTGSHGMQFRNGSERQLPNQGALLCGDWPGPKAWKGAVPADFYFAAQDLADDADLSGLVAFFFACYGAGTPALDEFARLAGESTRQSIAPHDFVAALPKRMLSRGALAVVGHVERAWGCSYAWPGAGNQTAVFESLLDPLLEGDPIGLAMEPMNVRYAELSATLADALEEMEFGGDVDPMELTETWTANNDARGYVILGDPAVRLFGAPRVASAEPGRPAELEIRQRARGPEPTMQLRKEGISSMEYKEVTLGPLDQRQMEKLVRFMADLLKDEGTGTKAGVGGVFVASPTSGDEDEGAGPGG